MIKTDLDTALERVLDHSHPYSAYRTLPVAYRILIDQEARHNGMEVEEYLDMKQREQGDGA